MPSNTTSNYDVAPFDDDNDEGEILSYAERGDVEEADDLAAGLAGGGGKTALPVYPPRSSAAAAAQNRRWLWYVGGAAVVVLVIAAVSGVMHKKSPPKHHGPAPILGVPTKKSPGVAAKPHPAAPVQSAPTHSLVPKHAIKVIATHPHDPTAFTEGLEYARGYLWESTGLRGASSLRRVRLDDGKVEQIYTFKDKNIFGEGITLHHDHHIFMLSWRSGRGFIFDQNTFKLLKEWRYKGQGWGLTMHDSAEEVWMSDGTDTLRVLEPEGLTEKRHVKVTLDGRPVMRLNEVEWVCGELWANIWETKHIYRIDPSTGKVKAIVDCSSLPLERDVIVGQDVLNGIAFDWESGRLWVTGKKWSKIYQIHVEDPKLTLHGCKP